MIPSHRAGGLSPVLFLRVDPVARGASADGSPIRCMLLAGVGLCRTRRCSLLTTGLWGKLPSPKTLASRGSASWRDLVHALSRAGALADPLRDGSAMAAAASNVRAPHSRVWPLHDDTRWQKFLREALRPLVPDQMLAAAFLPRSLIAGLDPQAGDSALLAQPKSYQSVATLSGYRLSPNRLARCRCGGGVGGGGGGVGGGGAGAWSRPWQPGAGARVSSQAGPLPARGHRCLGAGQTPFFAL